MTTTMAFQVPIPEAVAQFHHVRFTGHTVATFSRSFYGSTYFYLEVNQLDY